MDWIQKYRTSESNRDLQEVSAAQASQLIWEFSAQVPRAASLAK
jgi:hypothetical protein